MIHVKKLTKIFASGTTAIDELDLDVNEGEIFALLGPNGAGKSTTIRVLSTLSGFDSGVVTVAGHNVDTAPEKVRESIGLVAQQTGVDNFLTGRENLNLHGNLYHLGKTEIEDRLDELSKYFELEGALDRQVMTYSGGMRRKLDIATALLHKPRLLFLDEPTLGLDIKSRKSLWQYIQQLNKELGLTILLTTHYLEEADSLSDRVAIIDKGKIKCVDTPENLKSQIGGDVVTLSFEQRSEQTAKLEQALSASDYVLNSLWEGNRFHLYVDHGASSIPRIAQGAAVVHARITEISLRRPTLDDVFIKLTGASLEQDEDAGGEEWWHQWAGQGGGGHWQKKWQEQQDETDGDTAPADWQKWQQDGADTTDEAPQKPAAATDAQHNDTAEDNAEQAKDWQKWSDGDNADWQKWQNTKERDD